MVTRVLGGKKKESKAGQCKECNVRQDATRRPAKCGIHSHCCKDHEQEGRKIKRRSRRDWIYIEVLL